MEGGKGNGGGIVMGAHWNTQNTSKHITILILMYFAYSNGLPSQYCHQGRGGPSHLVYSYIFLVLTSSKLGGFEKNVFFFVLKVLCALFL